MNIVILNGSPKPSGGNSGKLCEFLKKKILSCSPDIKYTVFNLRSAPILESDFASIDSADVIVFAFPLYFGSFPSHLVTQMEKLEDWYTSRKGEKSPAKNKLHVYGLCNCGNSDGKVTSLALRMLRVWSIKCGFVWGQGVGIGGGEILDTVSISAFGNGIFHSAGKVISTFALNITQKKCATDIFAGLDLPRFLFIQHTNIALWEKACKNNGLSKKQMYYKIP